MNLHFSSMEYSFLTYGTNIKAAQTKWNCMSEQQRFRYEWLSQKYPHTQDLVYAYIGSQFDDVSIQFGQRESIVDAFFKFKGRRESLTHNIKSDFIKHELTDFIPIDKLIFKYFVGEYSPEYIILLTENTNDLLCIYDLPNFSWARPKLLKLIKYKSFFNTEKYTHLIAIHEDYVH